MISLGLRQVYSCPSLGQASGSELEPGARFIASVQSQVVASSKLVKRLKMMAIPKLVRTQDCDSTFKICEELQGWLKMEAGSSALT